MSARAEAEDPDADADVPDIDEDEANKAKTAKEEGKALNAITDRVEERHLNESKVQEALKRLAESGEERAKAQQTREKELAAVKINPADVDIIAAETEWDKKVAERSLREHKGDVMATLRAVYLSS